jgi:SPIRAL1-like protein
MGRGVSSGGGQSSLGYLFGSDPAPAAGRAPSAAALEQQHTARQACADAASAAAAAAREAPPAVSQPPKELPAAGKAGDSGTSLDMGAARLGRNSNNYHRADGQNTGNFITDRPSTKVHSAPGGGSSLGYLFGGN